MSDEDRARAVEEEGDIARRQGRKEEAVERYRTAWGFFKHPATMCNLGELELEIGRARDAAESLTTCLRLMKPEVWQVLGRKMERDLKKVTALVGRLRVEANVPDAEVFVDGKLMGKLPLVDPIFVEPVSHGVEVKASGYETDARIAFFHAGSALLMTMRLEPVRIEIAPPPHDRGSLEPKGEAESPSGASSSTLLAPSPGLAPKVATPAPSSVGSAQLANGPARGAVILTGFGLGVAGATLGTAGLIAGGAAREEAKTTYRALAESSTKCTATVGDPCAGVDAAIDRGVALTAVGMVGLALSAAGGALIVYELVRSTPQGGTANARIAIVPAPSGGVLNVVGSF